MSRSSKFLFASLLLPIAACGGKHGGGGGGSPSCSLATPSATVTKNASVPFTVRANFKAAKVEIDDVLVYDEAHQFDLSDDATTPAAGPFEKTFSRRVASSGKHTATVAADGVKVACATDLTTDGQESPSDDATPVSDDVMLAFTSTAEGSGKHQTVVRCAVPNKALDYDVLNGEYLMRQGYAPQQCDLGSPQAELASGNAPENLAPSAWLPGGVRAAKLPVMDDFRLLRTTGDTTDKNFTVDWDLDWPEATFARYADCKTLKLETDARGDDYVLKQSLVTWNRVVDPISGAPLWRLKDGETLPSGVSVRAAFQRRAQIFLYCDWNHKPAEMVVTSPYSMASDAGTFTPPTDMRFDVSVAVNGADAGTQKNASLDDFRKIVGSVSAGQGDTVSARVTLKNGAGQVVATNDPAAVPEALKARWATECEGKAQSEIALLADGDSTLVGGNGGRIKATFRVCDFNSVLLSDVKAVETKLPDTRSRQVVLKCVLTDNNTSDLFLDYGKTDCGYGTPPGETATENMVPAVYANGGARSQYHPWLEDVRLLAQDGNAADWRWKWYSANLEFTRLQDCRTLKIAVPLAAGGEALVEYRHRFDGTSATGSVADKLPWERLGAAPAASAIQGADGTTMTVYLYCDWPVVDFGEGVPVQ
jgi:hypothetical protein